jgi:hypothetical protein
MWSSIASLLMALPQVSELPETCTTQDGWSRLRELEEWLDIVADPDRVAPLHAVVRALAKAGVDAGTELTMNGDAVTFVHRSGLIVGCKS